MEINKDIKYVGVNDHEIDLFEGQYRVPNGISYNSYVILDAKIAVMDTVDKKFTAEWLANIDKELSGKAPDYLIVQHMEPDHSASLKAFADKYPNAVVVATSRAFTMMSDYYGEDYSNRRVVVKEGDALELGAHKLDFIEAPMVHWPEVMVSYDSHDCVLFSADGFGKFGALDVEGDWVDEARRYYIGIVGKYGAQVQALFRKIGGIDIRMICPLHGPVLKENLGYYLGLYNTWSGYDVELEGVLIAYVSMYGHTSEAAELLADMLRKKGCPAVKTMDLARCDMPEAVALAFAYGKIVLASPTYNAGVLPFMKDFINRLTERNFQKRTVAFIENGSWGPMAAKTMSKMLEGCKNITYLENNVTVRASVTDEDKAKLNDLAEELLR